MERSRIEWLAQRLVQGLADSREQEEFFAWVREQKDNAAIHEIAEKQWQDFETRETLPGEKNEQLFRAALGMAKLLQEGEPAIVRPFLSRKRWAAAAAILALLLVSGYFFLFQKTGKQDVIIQAEPAKDVKPPGTNRATIRLADGRTVYLDSAGNGQLAVQGNVKLVKLANGQIAYETASGEIVKELQYNTLSNPRGSKVIDMQLSDGSHVWLNAGSSVTYPVAFVGNERNVTITGEAYFEIAHDKTKPFTVSKGGMNVEVLGTKFNVNAYDDEAAIKVTLLEGSVKVNSAIIRPGQQAQVSAAVKVISDVDLEEVMAWKNGLFSFNRADIKTVMRQLARWYDVEVYFEGDVPSQLFGGEIQRTVMLSKVLENLERYGVRFRIENKKIIVTP